MELGGNRPPAQFASAIRKAYPIFETTNQLTIGLDSTHDTNHIHLFKSQKGHWTITLKQNAFSLETTSYTRHDKMREKVEELLAAALPVIDSEFFTRIGLRYINHIDVGADPLDGWINEDLTAPLQKKLFYGVAEYGGKLLVEADDGGCLLQHSIQLGPKLRDGTVSPPAYILDIDAFRTDVAVGDAMETLDGMHQQAFNVFDWAIGPKLRAQMLTSN